MVINNVCFYKGKGIKIVRSLPKNKYVFNEKQNNIHNAFKNIMKVYAEINVNFIKDMWKGIDKNGIGINSFLKVNFKNVIDDFSFRNLTMSYGELKILESVDYFTYNSNDGDCEIGFEIGKEIVGIENDFVYFLVLYNTNIITNFHVGMKIFYCGCVERDKKIINFNIMKDIKRSELIVYCFIERIIGIGKSMFSVSVSDIPV